MKNYKISEYPQTATTKEADRLAEKLGVEVTALEAVTTTFPEDITKCVKSYEDACAVLGIYPESDDALTKSGFTKDEIAYRKLKTITEALNEGWRPDWANRNQWKYWPWFVFYGASAGFAFALTSNVASTATAPIGSRLCFKTRELATFAGTQFIDIYNELILTK